MVPTLRPRFDDKSYLYNTDGLVFEEAGYPVLFLNEHINRWENSVTRESRSDMAAEHSRVAPHGNCHGGVVASAAPGPPACRTETSMTDARIGC